MANEKPLTLKFACGRCDARLTVKSLLAGKKINCPKCHKKILVPKEDDGVAEVPDDLSVVAPDAEGAKGGRSNAPAPRQDPAPEKPASPQAADKPVDASAGRTEQKPSETEAVKAPDKPVEKKETQPASPSVAPSSPPAPSPAEDSPKAAALAAAEAAVKEKDGLLEQHRRELDALRNQVAEQERRETERTAELEALRRREAEVREQLEKQAARHTEQSGQAAAQQEQALQAAQRKVADLERRMAQQAQRAPADGAAPAMPPPVTSTSPDEEGPDPDALIVGLQQSSLRRGLRLSLAAHAALLLVTSIGFIVWIIRGRPEPEPEEQAVVEAPRAPGAAEREEAAMALDAPPARRDDARAQPAEPERPRSSIEEAVESLPEPGETPTPSDIELELDF